MQVFGTLLTSSDICNVATFLWAGILFRWCCFYSLSLLSLASMFRWVAFVIYLNIKFVELLKLQSWTFHMYNFPRDFTPFCFQRFVDSSKHKLLHIHISKKTTTGILTLSSRHNPSQKFVKLYINRFMWTKFIYKIYFFTIVLNTVKIFFKKFK